jgi:hypothetical protein
METPQLLDNSQYIPRDLPALLLMEEAKEPTKTTTTLFVLTGTGVISL